MKLFFLACAGGAIGAGCRHLVNILTVRGLGLEVPWATFAVNVLGSLVMGGLIAYLVYRLPQAVGVRVFLATGILGGFTTFSAFSIDTFTLIERGDPAYALAYVVGSVVFSVAMCAFGFLAMRMMLV